MRWEGSTAASQGAPALTWDQVAEMHASGLCTVGNHTWDHAGPDTVDEDQLDRCSDLIEARLGERPRALRVDVGGRGARAADGRRGPVPVGGHRRARAQRARLRPARAPPSARARRRDPLAFYRAKLQGRLLPERAYAIAGARARSGRRGGAAWLSG